MPHINEELLNNKVAAEGQVGEKLHIHEEGGIRVLFLGNSITLHERAPHLNWNRNCGMAASCPEKDYAHLVVAYLKKKYGKASYCIQNASHWERNFWDENSVSIYQNAIDFKPDIVIVRIGENINREAMKQYDLSEAFIKFVRRFSKGAKKVVVTNNFWEHPEMEIAQKAAAEANHAAFVNISDLGWLDENKAYGTLGGSGAEGHPGDLGMRRIADRIIEAL